MLHLNYKELLGQCTTDVKKVLQILLRVDNDLLTYFREKGKKEKKKTERKEEKKERVIIFQTSLTMALIPQWV